MFKFDPSGAYGRNPDKIAWNSVQSYQNIPSRTNVGVTSEAPRSVLGVTSEPPRKFHLSRIFGRNFPAEKALLIYVNFSAKAKKQDKICYITYPKPWFCLTIVVSL